jgi:hypothetical protein
MSALHNIPIARKFLYAFGTSLHSLRRIGRLHLFHIP